MDKTFSPIIIVILTAALGAMILRPLPGRAEEGPFGPRNEGRGPEGRAFQGTAPQGGGRRILEELNLTAEQKSKINEYRERDKEAFKAKREAVQNARRKLEEAMDNPAAGEEELKNLFSEVAKARSEVEAARFESMLNIRALLTPEQRKKFTELEGPRPGRMRRSTEERNRVSE